MDYKTHTAPLQHMSKVPRRGSSTKGTTIQSDSDIFLVEAVFLVVASATLFCVLSVLSSGQQYNKNLLSYSL